MIIFITVKGTSIRCPNKNIKLLPYTLEKIKDLNLDILVITDSSEIRDICIKYKIKCHITCLVETPSFRVERKQDKFYEKEDLEVFEKYYK